MKHYYRASKIKDRFFVSIFVARKLVGASRSSLRTAQVTMAAILFILLIESSVWAQDLTASWYSVQSLKDEGTYKYSKGVMANGQLFNERAYTCASCDYPIGSVLRVTFLDKSIIVKVTDRTNKRFKGKRIDLSMAAFKKLAPLSKGLIKVRVEKI